MPCGTLAEISVVVADSMRNDNRGGQQTLASVTRGSGFRQEWLAIERTLVSASRLSEWKESSK